MIFALITFFAAFSIEAIGTLVSVIGLSSLFGANPIIIALAVALDIGKLVVVSLLYKYWHKLGVIMKSYGLIAATVTMIITSAGAAGYLSGEFQKAMVGTQESGLKVDVLKGQIAKYEERKKQIDQQIAALPEKTTVNQRIRLINAFKQEQKDLQDKINEIDKQLPQMQIAQISVEAKAGPILFIAKAFNISVEEAVKWVILMIIFVFDPLAVFLIIAGNFLWAQRKPRVVSNGFTPPAPMPPAPAPEPDDLVERPHPLSIVEGKAFNPWEGAPELPKPEPVEEKRTPPEGIFDCPRHGWIASGDHCALCQQDDETAVNNVFVKEDGTIVRPQLPEVSEGDLVFQPKPAAEPAVVITSDPTSDKPFEVKFSTPDASQAVVYPSATPEEDARELEAQQEEYERREAARAGMSWEDWKAYQLAKLDRLQAGADAIREALRPREQITLSSLGVVKPDPDTITDTSGGHEVGLGTGVYTTGKKT